MAKLSEKTKQYLHYTCASREVADEVIAFLEKEGEGEPGPVGPQGAQGTQGETGLQGEQGLAGANALWNYTAAYSGGASYAIGDLATHSGQLWYRTDSHGGNVGDNPYEGSPYWDLIAAKGEAGSQGEQGETGLQGAQGLPGADFAHNTFLVTTATYSVLATDYYIGVNRSGPVSITLNTASDGKEIIIKDESGNCFVNKITLIGTVDNDAGGAILAINNGALHLVYRSGWRIA